LRNTGTIGLLLRAYRERMLISFGETLEELESSGFRLHKNLKEILLQETSTLMKQTEAISRLESKYLDQARELVLKATADLNCTISCLARGLAPYIAEALTLISVLAD